jgi:hypothetical protein
MLQLAVRSLHSIPRWLCCSLSPALQQIQQQTQHQQQGQAFHLCSPSSFANSNSGDEHKFVGAYTPVTKQLWLDRLKKAEQQQHQAAAGEPASNASADGQPAAKPPQVTKVEYPFKKDKFLLEMVSVRLQLEVYSRVKRRLWLT